TTSSYQIHVYNANDHTDNRSADGDGREGNAGGGGGSRGNRPVWEKKPGETWEERNERKRKVKELRKGAKMRKRVRGAGEFGGVRTLMGGGSSRYGGSGSSRDGGREDRRNSLEGGLNVYDGRRSKVGEETEREEGVGRVPWRGHGYGPGLRNLYGRNESRDHHSDGHGREREEGKNEDGGWYRDDAGRRERASSHVATGRESNHHDVEIVKEERHGDGRGRRSSRILPICGQTPPPPTTTTTPSTPRPHPRPTPTSKHSYFFFDPAVRPFLSDDELRAFLARVESGTGCMGKFNRAKGGYLFIGETEECVAGAVRMCKEFEEGVQQNEARRMSDFVGMEMGGGPSGTNNRMEVNTGLQYRNDANADDERVEVSDDVGEEELREVKVEETEDVDMAEVDEDQDEGEEMDEDVVVVKEEPHRVSETEEGGEDVGEVLRGILERARCGYHEEGGGGGAGSSSRQASVKVEQSDEHAAEAPSPHNKAPNYVTREVKVKHEKSASGDEEVIIVDYKPPSADVEVKEEEVGGV
ncbi:hypothetical protein HK097_005576, partial [Rhizophlyctis rosea]